MPEKKSNPMNKTAFKFSFIGPRQETFLSNITFERKPSRFYGSIFQNTHTYSFSRIFTAQERVTSMNRYILIILIAVLTATASFGQLEIKADSGSAAPGQSIKVGVKVKNFTNLIALQYSLQWDPNVLKFDTIANLNIPGLDPGFIGSHPDTLAKGRIGFVWISFQSGGNKLVDGTNIINFVFDVIGQKGDSSFISFKDYPTVIQALDSIQNEVSVVTISGLIKLDITSSTSDTKSSNWKLYTPDPNPFSGNANIKWDQAHSAKVEWSVFDMTGKRVFTKTTNESEGQHSWILDSSILPSSGTYLIQLKTATTQLTQKIVHNKP